MLHYANDILCLFLYLCFMCMNLCGEISKDKEMTREGKKQRDKNIENLKHFNQHVINEVTFF